MWDQDLESSQIMESTQAISWDAEEEEEEEEKQQEETEKSSESLQCRGAPVGQLHLFSGTHGPERDFPLYLGKNTVGRNPDCSVILPFPSISRRHAVIKISASNKAPLLQDCGSLSGTQIIRPPKVLGHGRSHRLRDQEFILFANLPCQYRRLDVPPYLVSRGPLIVEETPRLQGGSQSSRVLLAEDSEEEGNFPSGRHVVNGSRTTSSPLATIVPESDEEGPSPRVSGPPLTFDVGSDTDEELGQQSGVGVATTETQPVSIQPTKQRCKHTEVKRKAGGAVVGSISETSPHLGECSETDKDVHHQHSGSVGSDTDVEEQIPATRVVVPVKRRQALRGVGTRSPAASAVAHPGDSPAGSDIDMKEAAALQASTLERSPTIVVINSDTDDGEEVSVVLTLAHLKESSAGAALGNRDPDVKEDRAQPQVLVQQNVSGRDSDTDVEEELPGQKRETAPQSSLDRDGVLVRTHSKKSRHPLRPSDADEDANVSSAGSQVQDNQASLAMVGNHKEMEEKVPPGPAVAPGEKYQVPVEGTHQRDAEAKKVPLAEARPEEGPSSAVTDVRNSQLPAAGDAGTEWAAAVPEQERAPEVGAQGRSPNPMAAVEQVVVHTGTPGEPSQPQRGGAQTPTGRERDAHVGGTKDSRDRCDDASALDVPWEVLATQPFDPRESDAESQPIAIHSEAHDSRPSLPRALPQHPHLAYTSQVHREPLGIQDREMQTVEKASGISKEMTERVSPGRGPLEREIGERPPDGDQEGVMAEEERTRATEDRLQKGESDKVKMENPERDGESLKEEMETAKDEQEKEREVETRGPEQEGQPPGREGTLGGRPTGGRSHDQEGQIANPTPKPGVGAEDLEGLASALVVSGSQGDGGGDPVSSGRKQRGQRRCRKPPAETVSRGGPESPSPCLFPTMPEASAPPQASFTSQSQKHSPSQPLISQEPRTSSLSEQYLPETPHTKPNVRSRRSSKTTSSPLSSSASHTDQPPTPRPTSQATRGRTTRSSIRSPEPTVPTSSELQPPASMVKPVIPKPLSGRVTRGRTNRSSVKTAEPVVPTGPKILSSTSVDQPVTPNLTSQGTRARPSKSFVKTPEPLVSSSPELQPPTSTDQPVIPKLTSRVTRGRTNRSSAKTLEPVVPMDPKLQPPTCTDQPVTPNLTPQGAQGKPSKSSVKTPEPVVPTTPEFQPPTSIGQPVIPEAMGQSRTLKSSSLSIAPASTTPEQPLTTTGKPAPLEPITQVSHGRGRRAAGKQGPHTVPSGHRPCSSLSEPKSQSSISQSSGAESLAAIPEPVVPQLPKAPTHTQAPLTQSKAAGRSRRPLEHEPEASETRKRLSATTDSLPLQKRPRRGVFQKSVFPKEEDTAEVSIKEEPQDRAASEPGKRERDHAEDEPQGTSNRNLRRTKPTREAAAPKVLFTGVMDSRGEQAVLSLGGSLASSVHEASYLVTDRICRTVKFLCALGKGIPILSLNWLYQSRKAGHFLPPDEYLVADAEQEKNFSFRLRDSLNRAQEQRLLQGYEIHVTPGVQPPPSQMGEIISCCGGTVLPSMPRSYKPRRVVITCAQDLPRCTIPSRLGIPLVSSEFLLTGVLKQEATPEAFVLSSLKTSPT